MDYYIDLTLTNCTINPNLDPDTYVGISTEGLTLSINANDGYVFNAAPTAEAVLWVSSATNTPIPIEKVSDTEYKINNFVYGSGSSSSRASLTYYIEANAEVKQVDTKAFTLYTDLSNSVCNKDNGYTGKINVGETFTVNANSGYEFTETGSPKLEVVFTTSTGRVVTEYYQFNKISNTEYSLSDFIYDDSAVTIASEVTYTITAIASPIAEPKEEYGITQLYLVTDDNLKSFATLRFTNGGTETIDLGQYIISLVKLFINIDNSALVSDTLKLYNTNTDISCNVIKELYVTTDCGAIEIPGIINTNCKVEIYLPFYGVVDLTSYKEYISGKKLSLIYKTTLLNGVSLISLTCENLLLNFQCIVGYSIPYFINTYNNPVINNSTSMDANFLSDSYVPYVHIIPRYNYDFDFISCTSQEKRLLQSIFNEGVKI